VAARRQLPKYEVSQTFSSDRAVRAVGRADRGGPDLKTACFHWHKMISIGKYRGLQRVSLFLGLNVLAKRHIRQV
jgi:hypothetical protein